MRLRTAFRVMRRHFWRLIAAILLPPFGAYIFLFQLPIEYEATAQLVVFRGAVSGGDRAQVHVESAVGSEADLARVGRLASSEVLRQVSESANLAQDPEFGAAPPSIIETIWEWWGRLRDTLFSSHARQTSSEMSDAEIRGSRAAMRLQSRLSFAALPASDVVLIGVRSEDRLKARQIADLVASALVDRAAQGALDDEKRIAVQFEEPLRQLKNDAAASKRSLDDATEKIESSREADKAAKTRNFADLNAQLTLARAQTADRRSRLSAMQLPNSSAGSRGAVTEVLTSPVIGGLRIQESEAARRLEEVSQRYGENHPRVTEARSQLGQIQGRIASEVNKILESLKGELSVAQTKEKQIEEQVDHLGRELALIDQRNMEVQQIGRRVDADDAVYRDMQRRSMDVREQQARRTGRLSVLAFATLPTSPTPPQYLGVISLALAIGVIWGGLWVWVAESFDSGFRTANQIEQLVGLPLLGMIPLMREASRRKSSPVQYVTEKPISMYAEALRSVQTAIALSKASKKPRTIMITSSVPGEGKSTFACSLARLAAKSNPDKRIVIVDCDLRRSSVLKLLQASEQPSGIEQYLSGEKGLADVVGRDSTSGLFYVPACKEVPNSAELLASDRMLALIKALEVQFDIVFLDTPPLMAVPDPRVVAELVDYIVFLIQWEKTDRDLVLTALKLLAGGQKEVGVVLSQVDLRRHAHYGYADYGAYYSKYRDYYSAS